jgi:hypothetical protein
MYERETVRERERERERKLCVEFRNLCNMIIIKKIDAVWVVLQTVLAQPSFKSNIGGGCCSVH